MDVMQLAIKRARETMNQNLGGPFGAAVIDEDGTILSVTSNSVLGDQDPTAHAEVNAIREAGKVRGSHDLTGCVIYATGHPCPMCLSAIMWANIKTVYYGCTPADAEEIGFRDDFIYNFIQDGLQDETILKITEKNRQDCLVLFKEYHEQDKEIY
jgi:guanine deaminase